MPAFLLQQISKWNNRPQNRFTGFRVPNITHNYNPTYNKYPSGLSLAISPYLSDNL